jgi:hypothetical protein
VLPLYFVFSPSILGWATKRDPDHLLVGLGVLPILLGLGYMSGLVVSRLLLGESPQRSLFRSVALPLALSPIISTATITLLVLLDFGFSTSVYICFFLNLYLLLGLLLRDWVVRRRRSAASPDDSAEEKLYYQGAGGLSRFVGLTALALLLINMANSWLRWRADGRFHIGVTAEILRGGIPPTDPFFAGLDLQYMWFFHAWVASLKVFTSDASVPWLLVGSNLLGLAGFLFCTFCLARGLGRSRAGVIITGLVVLFGMGGLSWLAIPVKMLGAFVGAERGFGEIEKLFALWPPRIEKTLGFLSVGYDQPYLLRKFLVGTAMSIALAAAILQLELLRRRLFGGPARLLIPLALASGGAVVLHPMIGIPFVAVGCAAALAAPILTAWRGRGAASSAAAFAPAAAEEESPPVFARADRTTWGVALGAVAACAVGAALALPYLLLVTSGKEGGGGLPIDFYPRKVGFMLAGSIGVSLPIVVAWLRRKRAAASLPVGEVWLGLWGLLLVGFALFVRFPLERENIDKPSILAHLGLAVVAGGVLGRFWDRGSTATRRRLVLYLVALTVPTTLLLTATYIGERDPRTYLPHEKEAFLWIDEHAPKEAIVFDSQDRDRPGVEIPRRMYWGHEQFAATHEYPKVEINRRRALRDALFGPIGPLPSQVAELRAIGAPVYVIVRAGAAVTGGGEPSGRGPVDGSFGDGDFDPLATHVDFERVFDSDDTRVYRLRTTRTAAGAPAPK